MATKAELDALRTEVHAAVAEMRDQIEKRTVGSWFNNTLTLITRLGAAVAALLVVLGLVGLMVRYFDKTSTFILAVPAASAPKP